MIPTEDKRKSTRELLNVFGTGKVKRAISKNERNQIRTLNLEEKDIQEMHEEVEKNKETREFQSDTLVPCDKNGSFPQKIYNLEMLLDDNECINELKSMTREIKEVLKDNKIETDKYFGYFS